MLRIYRHPLAGNRPGFRELTIVLAGNSSDILLIPPGDALCTHKYAAILGNELEAEKDMYPDLKNKYLP